MVFAFQVADGFLQVGKMVASVVVGCVGFAAHDGVMDCMMLGNEQVSRSPMGVVLLFAQEYALFQDFNHRADHVQENHIVGGGGVCVKVDVDAGFQFESAFLYPASMVCMQAVRIFRSASVACWAA